MIENALLLHFITNVDSPLASAREFWRRKFGFPESVVMDPRTMAELAAEIDARKEKRGV